MGLVMEGDKYAILTDIAGAEDHYGDMDFKVAGTRDGITGLQMDIKVPNVTTAIMKEALEQARRGRLFILDKMYEALPQPRTAISQYAPRIYTLHIPTDKIRDVIGPGGKVIRGIIEQTGVKIDVEDDGTVHVASADEASANKAHADHHRSSPPARKSARPIWARWSAWWISARSSRSSPAPTACCTSAKSPRTASATYATS